MVPKKIRSMTTGMVCAGAIAVGGLVAIAVPAEAAPSVKGLSAHPCNTFRARNSSAFYKNCKNTDVLIQVDQVFGNYRVCVARNSTKTLRLNSNTNLNNPITNAFELGRCS